MCKNITEIVGYAQASRLHAEDISSFEEDSQLEKPCLKAGCAHALIHRSCYKQTASQQRYCEQVKRTSTQPRLTRTNKTKNSQQQSLGFAFSR